MGICSNAKDIICSAKLCNVPVYLDEDKQKSTDFVQYAYPFTLMASVDDQMIIPQIYTKKQWKQMQWTPFVKNVEHDKVVLV